MSRGVRRSAVLAGAMLAAMLAAPGWAGATSVAAAPAFAAPRSVVIVNLASDQASGARAAAALRAALAGAEDLAPLPSGDLTRALEGALGPDPAERALAEGQAHLAAAAAAFDRFKGRQARAELRRARAALLASPPEPRLTGLLAEVAFRTALVHLREDNRGLALAELELSQRLAPARGPLDPVRWPPQVIAADAEARRRIASADAGTLLVTATFDGAAVFVDGVRRGVTPATVEIGAGLHDVVVASPAHRVASARVEVEGDERIAVTLDLEPRSRVERAEASRHAVARGDLPVERAADLACELAETGAALVVTGAPPVVAVFEAGPQRLSFARPVDGEVTRLFGLLQPVGMPALVARATGPSETPPWYAEPWGVAAIGTGVVATVLGVLAAQGGDSEPGGFPWGVGLE